MKLSSSCLNKFRTYNQLLFSGNGEVDQVFMVLLSTSMFVGGLIGFILDNTVPGKGNRNIVRCMQYAAEVKEFKSVHPLNHGYKS